MNSQIEFIELNLIIFCDGETDTGTLGLLESLDLPDRETKNLQNVAKNLQKSCTMLQNVANCFKMLHKVAVYCKM